MKLLLASDFHGDHVSLGVSRYDEIERAAMQTVDAALRENVNAYVFLGDLCDPDSGPIVFRCVELIVRMAETLAKEGIDFVAIAGNHCVIEDGSGTTVLTPLRAFKSPRIKLHEMPGVGSIEGVPYLALPFTATSHPYHPTDLVEPFLDSLAGKPGLVFGHLSVPGVIPGEETTEMPRGREVTFPLDAFREAPNVRLFAGHYHRRQRLQVGKTELWIPGSLARLTFGEDRNDPGFLIVDTDA